MKKKQIDGDGNDVVFPLGFQFFESAMFHSSKPRKKPSRHIARSACGWCRDCHTAASCDAQCQLGDGSVVVDNKHVSDYASNGFD